MAGLLINPVLSAAGSHTTGLPSEDARTASDPLNKFLVVLFLTAGPVLGAVVFLTWFGGLAWGFLASLL